MYVFTYVYIYIYIYTYIYMYMHTYIEREIYVYTWHVPSRWDGDFGDKPKSIRCIYLFMYVYIYIYIERERERDLYVCIYIYIYMSEGPFDLQVELSCGTVVRPMFKLRISRVGVWVKQILKRRRRAFSVRRLISERSDFINLTQIFLVWKLSVWKMAVLVIMVHLLLYWL